VRALLRLLPALVPLVLCSGCIAISGTSSSQPQSLGPVTLSFSACSTGSPSCAGTPNSGQSIYSLLGDSDVVPVQLLVAVRLPAGASGRLILADAYYPGWTALVDGRPAPIDRYDGFLRAVPIPDGSREVVFEYRPGWLAPALSVNLLALAVVLGLLGASAPRALRRRRAT
jgi:hypothetical protein